MRAPTRSRGTQASRTSEESSGADAATEARDTPHRSRRECGWTYWTKSPYSTKSLKVGTRQVGVGVSLDVRLRLLATKRRLESTFFLRGKKGKKGVVASVLSSFFFLKLYARFCKVAGQWLSAGIELPLPDTSRSTSTHVYRCNAD